MLELVELKDFARHYPYQLSGGMQQRVSIARALALEPSILLMDEPFGALDEMTRERMNSEVQRIWQQTGTTVVFVTHSIPEAVFLSSRVVVMSPRPGRIVRVIDVDLPRPRTDDTRETPRYFELITEVRETLRGRRGRRPLDARGRLARADDGRGRRRMTRRRRSAPRLLRFHAPRRASPTRGGRAAGPLQAAGDRRVRRRPGDLGASASRRSQPAAQFILPRPSAIAAAFVAEWPTLQTAAGNTLYEALGGLVIGVTAGVLTAFAVSRWARVREAILPIAIGASAIPIIAAAPIMSNWFGILNPSRRWRS